MTDTVIQEVPVQPYGEWRANYLPSDKILGIVPSPWGGGGVTMLVQTEQGPNRHVNEVPRRVVFVSANSIFPSPDPDMRWEYRGSCRPEPTMPGTVTSYIHLIEQVPNYPLINPRIYLSDGPWPADNQGEDHV